MTDPLPLMDASPGRRSWSLFALGFLGLFLELVLIRYLAGSIWNMGFFPNLVLLGAFVGMGTGFVSHQFLSARASTRLFGAVPPALLGLVLLVRFLHPSVPGFEGSAGEVGDEIFYTGALSPEASSSPFLFLIWIFGVILIFAMISQYTAKIFAQLTPLKAYTLDIAGSCLGIVAFMLLSWWQLPAVLWFVLLMPLLLAPLPRLSPGRAAIVLAAGGAACLSVAQQDGRALRAPQSAVEQSVTWSPYQKIEFVPETRALYVNGIRHQTLRARGELDRMVYSEPHVYREERGLPPYERVLVIGAGGGNDVAAALLHGARQVDAVEIDPVIAALGKRFHPEMSYLDPRVRLTIGDGRAFLTNATERYDLIVFALTDSLVKVSPMAQLRLENYLFTRESMERAYDLLTPQGSLVLYNFYRRFWVVEKLELALQQITGGELSKLVAGDNNFALLIADRAPGPPRPPRDEAEVGQERAEPLEAATDDWPFPYLRQRSVSGIYLAAMSTLVLYMVVVLVLVQRGARRYARGRGSVATKLAFAAMGIAFLLLETKSIIQFSLLFGTTWLNNSLVFLAVLLLVLAANWMAHAVRARWLLWIVFPLLIASSLATLVYPLSNLLYLENQALRFGAASFLTFSPVFFANLLFSVALRDQAVAEHMFGWNLFGATLGGVLEYSSMALGYNALAWIVAACYAGAFLLLLAGGLPDDSTRFGSSRGSEEPAL